MAKIDIFTHVLPKKYLNALQKAVPPGFPYTELINGPTALWDLDKRFKIMDKYEDVTQVLTYAVPPLEAILAPKKAAELARRGNDELAEIVHKYPDRFAGGVATLPMNNIDAALAEVDRAIDDLKLKGIMLYTNINGKPLDSPEFMPIYEKMARHDLPIWLHPRRDETVADYSTESESQYRLYGMFGWPYETQLAMARLACSGVLEKYPNLKFITHQCAGGMPFFATRITGWGRPRGDKQDAYVARLSKPLIEYFGKFYADTTIKYTPALMCAYAFFGAEHMIFGSDMPFGAEGGEWDLREGLKTVEDMAVSDADKKKIFEGNARKLLHLPA